MRRIITGPDGTQHVLTEEQILHLALKQLFPPPKAEPELPPMVEMDEPAQPEMPQPPPEAAPPASPQPNPMEQIVPLIMDAVERLASSIDNMGAEFLTGLEEQGKKIDAAAAQQAQSMTALAEEMGAEKEVVRDDEGRVKGARRKPKELN